MMPQKQCPWCNRCGQRYDEGEATGPEHDPHANGSACVCRHVSTSSRLSALDNGGRYYSPGRGWVCPHCGTDAAGTDPEWEIIDLARTQDCSYELAAQLLGR